MFFIFFYLTVLFPGLSQKKEAPRSRNEAKKVWDASEHPSNSLNQSRNTVPKTTPKNIPTSRPKQLNLSA
jgi:hypothetical protein